jgi:hypothetical protein
MMPGEINGQPGSTGIQQLGRPHLPVVTVCGHPITETHTGLHQDRGERPTHDAHSSVSLRDIVRQRSDNRVVERPTPIYDDLGCLVRMSLIGYRLREEETRERGCQPPGDVVSLSLLEWAGEQDIEEPMEEMGRRARQGQWLALDLQSTQSTDAGLKSIRASPMSLPHLSHVP